MTGFILAGLAGAVLVGQATAQPNALGACQQQCDGDTICLQACPGEAKKHKRIVHRPDTPPPPPAVKTWQDDVFNQGKDAGGGGGGGGGGGR